MKISEKKFITDNFRKLSITFGNFQYYRKLQTATAVIATQARIFRNTPVRKPRNAPRNGPSRMPIGTKKSPTIVWNEREKSAVSDDWPGQHRHHAADENRLLLCRLKFRLLDSNLVLLNDLRLRLRGEVVPGARIIVIRRADRQITAHQRASPRCLFNLIFRERLTRSHSATKWRRPCRRARGCRSPEASIRGNRSRRAPRANRSPRR